MNRYLCRLGYMEKSAGVGDFARYIKRGIGHGIVPGAKKVTGGIMSTIDKASGSAAREVVSKHLPSDVMSSIGKIKNREHLSNHLHDVHFNNADKSYHKDFSEYSNKIAKDPSSAHMHSAEGASLKARHDAASMHAATKTKSIMDNIGTELEDSIGERSANKGALLVGGAALAGGGALAYKKGKKAGEANSVGPASMYLQEPVY